MAARAIPMPAPAWPAPRCLPHAARPTPRVQAKLEREKTKFVSDRAEEKRRGVEAIDVKEVSRLPEDYKQKELDKMNEAIENEAEQSKVRWPL